MNKQGWKERAKAAEEEVRRLTMVSALQALTFDNLTICFSERTVMFRGRLISPDANCVTFPLTNDQHLLARAGWYPIEEAS